MVVSLAAEDREALLAGEPLREVRRVGDEEEHDDGPEGAEGADDDELVLPGVLAAVDLGRGSAWW